MAKRLVKLPKGARPIGPLPTKTDLSNVVFVCFTNPTREIVEQPKSKVIYVYFENRCKLGHVS